MTKALSRKLKEVMERAVPKIKGQSKLQTKKWWEGLKSQKGTARTKNVPKSNRL